MLWGRACLPQSCSAAWPWCCRTSSSSSSFPLAPITQSRIWGLWLQGCVGLSPPPHMGTPALCCRSLLVPLDPFWSRLCPGCWAQQKLLLLNPLVPSLLCPQAGSLPLTSPCSLSTLSLHKEQLLGFHSRAVCLPFIHLSNGEVGNAGKTPIAAELIPNIHL